MACAWPQSQHPRRWERFILTGRSLSPPGRRKERKEYDSFPRMLHVAWPLQAVLLGLT
jgi:hypothetical protein